MTFLAFLFVAAFSSAASFPIGIYGVNDPADLPVLQDAGFTAVQTYAGPGTILPLAKAAERRGISLLAHPFELMKSTVPAEGLPIAAWYLVDEPDVQKMPPDKLKKLDQQVRAWAPQHKTAFVVGDGRTAKTYADSGDILMVDWYPVPHLPLTSAGEHVRYTVEAAKGKPVWAVLQAMDWRWYPQRNPKKPRIGRFPTIAELRFMSYHSILEGASGLWYFTWDRRLSDAPELWSVVIAVTRELSSLRPVLEDGEPIALPFKKPLHKLMRAKAWKHRSKDYVLLLNTSPNTALLMPKELLGERWRPLFEKRRYVRELLMDSNGAYYLRPLQFLLLEGAGVS
ncbi:MAG: hypothetical protein WC728_12090 [Elusimicrobiota bacterium]